MTAAIIVLAPEIEAAVAGEAAGGMEALSAEEAVGEAIPRGIDLGGGHRLELSEEQFRQILHSAQVVEAIRSRAQGVADECNATKKKKRAVYEVLIQNDPTSTRARAFVRPGNADAFHDDARNSTMLKAAANAPSDPKIAVSSPEGTDEGMPSGGEDFEGEAAAGEEAAVGEAAAGAEMSELAEVAILAL